VCGMCWVGCNDPAAARRAQQHLSNTLATPCCITLWKKDVPHLGFRVRAPNPSWGLGLGHPIPPNPTLLHHTIYIIQMECAVNSTPLGCSWKSNTLLHLTIEKKMEGLGALTLTPRRD